MIIRFSEFTQSNNRIRRNHSDSLVKPYINGHELCNSILYVRPQKIMQIIDLLIDYEDHALLHLVTSCCEKRLHPIVVPISFVNEIDLKNNKVKSELDDDTLQRSPAFNPKTFNDWEHQMLTQFFNTNVEQKFLFCQQIVYTVSEGSGSCRYG